MKKNKIILIIVLLLIIFSICFFIVSSYNFNHDLKVTNNTTNNSNINKSITNNLLDVNNSLNNSDNDNLEDNSPKGRISSDTYSSSSKDSDSNKNSDSKSKSDKSDDEFTASDARKVVKNHVGGVDDYDISDLKVGKPKYKDSDGSWLVPLYDKKTGKFVDSVFAYDDGMTYGGENDYNNYKRIISGKEPKKSESNFIKIKRY